MQGKALVVNPAVIHPSATPTIVVGRSREKARKSRVRNRKFETRTRPNNHQLQCEPNGNLACGTLIKWNEPNMSISSLDSFASAHRGGNRAGAVASHPRERIQF